MGKTILFFLIAWFLIPAAVFADEGAGTWMEQGSESGKVLVAQSDEEGAMAEAEKALEPEEEPKRAAPIEIERGGILLAKGKAEIDLGLTYAHFSTNQIFIHGFAILPVLAIGEITVERIRRDIFIGSVGIRYGLFEDCQIELNVPWRYWSSRRSRPEETPAHEVRFDGSGMGDIEGGVYYQFLKEREGVPNLIVGVTGKSRTGKDVFELENPNEELPTGTGFWSVKGTLTAVKTLDPVVVFGTMGFTYNIERDDIYVKYRDRRIDLDPGNTYEYGFGFAYAISPKFSTNLQYQQAITLSSKVDGVTQVNTNLNVVVLKLGAVYSMSKRTSLDVSVSTGLTDDAPDVVIELRIPFRF